MVSNLRLIILINSFVGWKFKFQSTNYHILKPDNENKINRCVIPKYQSGNPKTEQGSISEKVP